MPGPNKVSPSDPDKLALIRSRLNQSQNRPDDIIGPGFGGVQPRAPRAAPFRPETLVWGNPEVARQYDKLQRAVPEVRGRANYINTALPESSINNLANRLPQNDAFRVLGGQAQSNLMGQTDYVTRNLYVSPDYSPKDTIDTIGHELQHLGGGAQGFFGQWYPGPTGTEQEATKTGNLIGDYFYPKSQGFEEVRSPYDMNPAYKNRKKR